MNNLAIDVTLQPSIIEDSNNKDDDDVDKKYRWSKYTHDHRINKHDDDDGTLLPMMKTSSTIMTKNLVKNNNENINKNTTITTKPKYSSRIPRYHTSSTTTVTKSNDNRRQQHHSSHHQQQRRESSIRDTSTTTTRLLDSSTTKTKRRTSSSSSSHRQERWRSAMDPKSGKIYYYDVNTRRTQWETPPNYHAHHLPSKSILPIQTSSDSSSPVAVIDYRQQRDFFSQMEHYMKCQLSDGVIPGIDEETTVVMRIENRRQSGLLRHGESSLEVIMDDLLLAELAGFGVDDDDDDDDWGCCDDEEEMMTTTCFYDKPVSRGRKSHVRRYSGDGIRRWRGSEDDGDGGGGCLSLSLLAGGNDDDIIKCISAVYWAHIILQSAPPDDEEEEEVGNSDSTTSSNNRHHPPPFSSPSNDDNNTTRDHKQLPSLTEIITFVKTVTRRSQMEFDCLIVTLIYVERAVFSKDVRITSENWKNLLLSCMMVASKVWDDLSMVNVDFMTICRDGEEGGRWELEWVNRWEWELLRCLNFNLQVMASDYARYYFLLRSVMVRCGIIFRDGDDDEQQQYYGRLNNVRDKGQQQQDDDGISYSYMMTTSPLLQQRRRRR